MSCDCCIEFERSLTEDTQRESASSRTPANAGVSHVIYHEQLALSQTTVDAWSALFIFRRISSCN
jgi:hypothetical protein